MQNTTGRRDGRTIHDFIFGTQVIYPKKLENERYLNDLDVSRERMKGMSYYD